MKCKNNYLFISSVSSHQNPTEVEEETTENIAQEKVWYNKITATKCES